MNIIEWIKSLFSKFVKMFKTFINLAFPIAKQIIIGQLQGTALEIVTDLATTDISNEDKRNQAFERIKNVAITRGIAVGDSLLNAIIEIAVQVYKEETE